MRKGLVALAAVGAIGIFGWILLDSVNGPPVIKIVNMSDERLTSVKISEGWSRNLTDIAPHSSFEFIQHVRGEAGPKLTFSAKGKVVEQGVGYIEEGGGYCSTLTVQPDLSVQMDVHIGCFRVRRGF